VNGEARAVERRWLQTINGVAARSSVAISRAEQRGVDRQHHGARACGHHVVDQLRGEVAVGLNIELKPPGSV
jgi:chorismate-pyruvate lyase